MNAAASWADVSVASDSWAFGPEISGPLGNKWAGPCVLGLAAACEKNTGGEATGGGPTSWHVGRGVSPHVRERTRGPKRGKRERREKGESSKYGTLFGCGNYSSRLLRCFFFFAAAPRKKGKGAKRKGKRKTQQQL